MSQYKQTARDQNRLLRSLIRRSQQVKGIRAAYRPYWYKRRHGI